MKRTCVVGVLVLALGGACTAQTRAGLGFWEGQRSIGIVSDLFSISALEGGGYLNLEAGDNLGFRFQISYLKGSVNSSSSGSGYTSEDDMDLSGFPVQFCVLPTVRIGDRFLVRAGGGLSYYKLTAKETYTSMGGTVTDSYGMSGFGGQFLLTAEGKLNPKVGLEAQYERGTAKLSYTTTSSGVTHKDEFGTTPEAYRIGLAFHF